MKTENKKLNPIESLPLVKGRKLSLLEKIQLVSDEIGNIDKLLTVGTGNGSYKAVSDLSVLWAVKKAETKHGVVSIAIKQELVESDKIKAESTYSGTTKTTIKYHFVVKMTTRIYNIEDSKDFIDIETFGHGLDSGDKAFGKASTYARKYALLNIYKIATGEDPDANKSDDTDTPPTTDERMVVVENYFATDEITKTTVMQWAKVHSVRDFTEKQLAYVHGEVLKKMKK